ncbi:MAG TPA: hypothetical protein PKE45_05310, partial [Caldilineaceae bacterium]|nr:hypothetical protein [Caldilineaceae bacterium]
TPGAGTNIAPAVAAPAEPALYAFTYANPASAAPPSFVVAGAGDLRDQADLTPAAVVRPGETTVEALREKVACVMAVMTERLTGLGMRWEEATAIDLYTTENLQPLLADSILRPIGQAAFHGLHWFHSHPPIADLAFEMDVRGLRQEHRLRSG